MIWLLWQNDYTGNVYTIPLCKLRTRLQIPLVNSFAQLQGLVTLVLHVLSFSLLYPSLCKLQRCELLNTLLRN